MNKLFFGLTFATGLLAKSQLNMGENATLPIIMTFVCLGLAIITTKELREWL